MQVGFICTNGEEVLFKDCMENCKNHCVSLPTLSILSKQRPWTGLPSTTQLITGTRYTLLKIFKDYYEDIQKLAWILLGNKVHKSLEDNDTEGTSEISFANRIQSGIADYYSPKNFTLWDYKNSGSYKVKKALGLVSIKISDPLGERYKKSGRGYKKGDIKQVTVWNQDQSAVDMWEWILQTNRYAIWLEDSGRPVKKIKIEIIVRDGGLKAAATYGIDKNIVVIDIPILDRKYVLDYFNKKAKTLRTAIALMWSPLCNNKETWGGRKCENYCPVSKYCKEMPEHSNLENRFDFPQILC